MKYSRRNFLKVAGAATISSMIPATPTISAESSRSTHSNTLKVGLIGCGGRGSGATEEALNVDSNIVLTAMADVFDDQLETSYRRLKEKFPQKVQVSPDKKFIGLDAYQKLINSDWMWSC